MEKQIVVFIIHLTEKQGKFKRIKRYTFFIPPEENLKESKIRSTDRLVALSEDCRRSSLQSLHLIFCELLLRDQGLRLTEAQWYSLSHNLKRMVVLYEKMSQIYCFKAHAAPAISLHSITFAALVYTALTH